MCNEARVAVARRPGRRRDRLLAGLSDVVHLVTGMRRANRRRGKLGKTKSIDRWRRTSRKGAESWRAKVEWKGLTCSFDLLAAAGREGKCAHQRAMRKRRVIEGTGRPLIPTG
jgi:hypothetical protein